MVHQLRLLERGPVAKAADRLVRAVLEQLRGDGGVALRRRSPEWGGADVRPRLVDVGAGCDELRHNGEVAVLRRDEDRCAWYLTKCEPSSKASSSLR